MPKPQILVLEGLSGSSHCVRRAGGDAIRVAPTDFEGVEDALKTESIHGVLFTGGGDVDPTLYGQKPHKKVYGVSETRDLVEQWVLLEAAERNWPVMGICRGNQIMNVTAGGNLIQHIGGHYGGEHPIRVVGKTLNKALRFCKYPPVVVSLHHQAVRKLAQGFRVAARAYDGTIEAIESVDGRCLGLQYHPEMDESAAHSLGVFRWLVEESARRAEIPLRVQRRKAKKSRKVGDVRVRYYCPACQIERFDREEDFEDHMAALHGMGLARAEKFAIREPGILEAARQRAAEADRKSYHRWWDAGDSYYDVETIVAPRLQQAIDVLAPREYPALTIGSEDIDIENPYTSVWDDERIIDI